MAQLGSTKIFGDLQVTGQATLDRPKVSTGIFDINGNEVLNIVPTTAAVNELSIKNAATGGDVLLTTAGTDTNINLLLQTKGTGTITLDTGAGAGAINLKSGTDPVRIWDDDSSHYYQFLTGNRTANYSITLPAATGTMLIANSTANTAGYFDTSTTTPTGSTRLNYSGYLYPTFLNLTGSADTATAATHYFVETGSDGFVRPKTLANARTEIVTTAAVNAAAATTVGTITSGVWNGTAIPVANGGTGATTAAAALTNLGITATAAELNYTGGVTSSIQTQLNAKAPLASPALTGTPTAPTAATTTNTTQIATTAFVQANCALQATLTGATFTGPVTLTTGRAIGNNTATGTAVYGIWSGTQAQYDAIATKDANTLYFIA